MPSGPLQVESGSGAVRAQDAIFLTCVVALSAAPYLHGLGYYSDDYAHLATLSQVVPDGFTALYEALVDKEGLGPRPLQAAYLATAFKLFGVAPLAPHLINHGIFGMGILLFHAGLRTMGVGRFVAVALPLVFTCMPHYSTVRFWIAAHQITIAMAAFFLAFYCAARFLHGPGAGRRLWLVLGCGAIATSGMAYETFLPLVLAVPLVVWLPGAVRLDPRLRLDPAWRRSLVALLWLLLAYGGATPAIVAVKLWLYGGRRVWHGDTAEWVRTLGWLYEGALKVTFIDNGASLPRHVATLAAEHWRTGAAAAAFASLILVLGYLRTIAMGGPQRRQAIAAGSLAAVGFVVFLGGYAAFANSFNVGFSPTGIANRAASVGVAAVALATAMAAGLAVPARMAGSAVSLAVAAFCAAGIFITGTLGAFWAEAAREQQVVLAKIRAGVPELGGPTALLLDGACPFIGPAPIFESAWDLAGALRLIYGDPSIRADVVKRTTLVGAEAIVTTHYDVLTETYPYGPLIVFDLRAGKASPLPDRQAAQAYFDRSPPAKSAACAFEDGAGVSVY